MDTRGGDAKPFRILSLDGGGIRGGFIAGFLAELEQRLNCRLADYFDLIAGTSTGAIIAAALAIKEPASRIETLYRQYGDRIFRRREPVRLGISNRLTKWGIEQALWWTAGKSLKELGLDFDQLLQSKYDGKELRNSLTEVFGNKRLGEVSTRVVIPAIDLTRGQPIVFKTPHTPNLIRDRHFNIVDVLMATTAAPTYFPHGGTGIGSIHVDGGLWANNPSMVALVETLLIREKALRSEDDFAISQDQIYMLSVGTGNASYAERPDIGQGHFWWLPRLFNVSSIAQAQGANFQAKFLLGDHLHRIDFSIPDKSWSLDAIDKLDLLINLGHLEAASALKDLRPTFFDVRSQHPYKPFPDAEHAS